MPRSALLLLIDGLRPDAIAAAHAPTLRRLSAEGASTLTARTVMPAMSLPCHASIFHGVPPDRHGVWANTWRPIDPPVPSVVDVVHAAGRPTAMFFDWGPLRDLAAPPSVDELYYVRHTSGPRDPADARVFAAAADFLRRTPHFGFAFVYFGAADFTGHEHQWMSAPYLDAVAEADRLLATDILPHLPSDCLLIVTADHGGHDWTHGEDCHEDLTVPLILHGPGISPATTLPAPVTILDLAPTIADWLDVPRPPEWVGRSLLRPRRHHQDH